MALATPVFLHGGLARGDVAAAALGRSVDPAAARLADHALDDGVPVPRPGGALHGVVLADLGAAEAERLAALARALRLWPATGRAETDAGPQTVRFFTPDDDGSGVRLLDGDLALVLVEDIMADLALMEADAIAARLMPLAAKAQGRLLARGAAPTTLRRRAAAGDVAVADRRKPYAHFFEIRDYTLSWRCFDGAMSAPHDRAAFVSADSAVVLPYDAGADRVLLVEQFRPGPFARGDPQPWHLEPVAGHVDPGERPEETARREAREEAGLTLDRLEPIAGGYPCPGAKAEFLHIFLGHARLDEAAATIGGLASEGEDIRSHVIAFERLMELVATGEAATLPLLLAAHWLARNRPRLRGRG